jgi:hypothetical protein
VVVAVSSCRRYFLLESVEHARLTAEGNRACNLQSLGPSPFKHNVPQHGAKPKPQRLNAAFSGYDEDGWEDSQQLTPMHQEPRNRDQWEPRGSLVSAATPLAGMTVAGETLAISPGAATAVLECTTGCPKTPSAV